MTVSHGAISTTFVISVASIPFLCAIAADAAAATADAQK